MHKPPGIVVSLSIWVDRISVRRSTNYSAVHLLYARDCLLPVDLGVMSGVMSGCVLDWEGLREYVRIRPQIQVITYY